MSAPVSRAGRERLYVVFRCLAVRFFFYLLFFIARIRVCTIPRLHSLPARICLAMWLGVRRGAGARQDPAQGVPHGPARHL
jgi:hypothetical protein